MCSPQPAHPYACCGRDVRFVAVTADLNERLQAALGAAYLLREELGGGGMSRVFVADEVDLDRKVVVKVLLPDLSAGLSADRFRREVQMAAKLQHPHIVPLLAAGEREGLHYYLMPLVEGRSLRDAIQPGQLLPIPEVIRILQGVAAALACAHARGIVHRDIKPENVLLSGGVAMVTDFGIAKALSSAREEESRAAEGTMLTVVGMSLGTPPYMAPEQGAADPTTDHRADIYSFGIVAYELLTGETPFGGRSTQATIAAHLVEPPPPIESKRKGIPAGLIQLVNDCLAKNPADRPQTADAIVERLSGPLDTGARAGWPTLGGGSARAMMWRASAVVLLLAIGGALALRWRGAAHAADRHSVAVLALDNVGNDPRNEYFSDGLADELTTALDRVPGLRVASRTSSFSFKGKHVDAREIAKTLNVGSLLEGSVRRDGARMHVTARLTSASDGLTLWSASYERATDDVFAVQDSIAGGVSRALTGGGDQRSAAVAPAGIQGTTDVAAYDLYLRGRFYWHQRGEAALRQAAGLFEQAIARDQGFARAYAGLADALALLPIYGPTPADSVAPQARSAALRALALDSTLADAYTTLGLVQKNAGEWAESERSLAHALALDPRNATSYQWLGELNVILGRRHAAAEAMRKAAVLEPTSPIIAAEVCYVLALDGQYKDAYAAGDRAVSLDPALWPGHAFLGFAYQFAGDHAHAVPELERARQLSPQLPVAADSIARSVVTQASAGPGAAYAAAITEMAVGQDSSALKWLERAARMRDPWLLEMSFTPPWFDRLRASPQLAAVAHILDLPPSAARGKE
jgi:TolB-like protein/tetratricopeptide (TPR) repeat protein/tRNA A-37 threonylcarbamoyl transferase component Bud32